MKIDKFTWIVIILIIGILAAAVVSVNRGGNEMDAAYSTVDDPTTPIYNIFLALQQNDQAVARTYYSQAALAQFDDPEYGSFFGYYGPEDAQRLRILSTSVSDENPDLAYVTFAVDNYRNGGPFGSGSTYTYENTLEVIREDDAWKVNSASAF